MLYCNIIGFRFVSNKKARMTAPLISVIIPVYNAEIWLREALDSLKEQTYATFEAIMVCDGSTDRSADICREFSESDSRFKLIVMPNGGVSAARNRGVADSSGEWICFLDADDLLPSDSLSVLLAASEETNTRIAVGTYIRGNRMKQDMRLNRNKIPRLEVVSSDDAIAIGLYQRRILNSPCGVIFHRSLFNDAEPLLFRTGRYEDLDFFYRAFERTDRICLTDECVYFYRDNPASFINTWSRARLDALDVTDRIVAHMDSRSVSLQRAARDRRFSAHFNILLLMLRHGVNLPAERERCLNVIKKYRREELLDPQVRIKNKLGALFSYLGLPAIRLLCKLSH